VLGPRAAQRPADMPPDGRDEAEPPEPTEPTEPDPTEQEPTEPEPPEPEPTEPEPTEPAAESDATEQESASDHDGAPPEDLLVAAAQAALPRDLLAGLVEFMPSLAELVILNLE